MDKDTWENLRYDSLVQHIESGFIFRVWSVSDDGNQIWIRVIPLDNYIFPNGATCLKSNKYLLGVREDYIVYTEPEEEFNRLSVIE